MTLSPEEHERARLIDEQDRIRFRKEAHKNGRWDEAHFGVGVKSARKPEPKPSRVWPLLKGSAVLGVLVCAGLFTADWLGAVDLGIRAALRPDTSTTALGMQQERAAAAIEQELGDSPYGAPTTDDALHQPASRSGTLADLATEPIDAHEQAPAEPLGVMVNHTATAKPATTSTAAQIAARKRGLDHLMKQRQAAQLEVNGFLAVIKRAEMPSDDGLTYEQRLTRNRKAAHASGAITSERVRLDLAWERYLAGKNENATRLTHARDVLASLDRRHKELSADQADQRH